MCKSSILSYTHIDWKASLSSVDDSDVPLEDLVLAAHGLLMKKGNIVPKKYRVCMAKMFKSMLWILPLCLQIIVFLYTHSKI